MHKEKCAPFMVGLLLLVSFNNGPNMVPELFCAYFHSHSQLTGENSVAIHENAWETVVDKAEEDQYYTYSIYVTRTLAVRHPEIYLKADGLFAEIATTNQGFKKAFETTDVHDQYLYGRYKEGPPFTFDDVDFAGYNIILSEEYYPEGYPVLPFLDRRMLPLASTLKSVRNQITQLEKGVQFYFATKKESGINDNLYLIYCDNENTYVWNDQTLISMRTMEPETLEGNPILIFNEEYVWYPLMERDDTDKDSHLKEIVIKYTTEVTPSLLPFEKEIIDTLKDITSLHDDLQKDMAIMASLRLAGYLNRHIDSDSFRNLWESGINFVAERRTLLKYGNYLSPVTAYLAAIKQEYDGEEKISKITREYLKYTTYKWDKAHGHVWFCDLVEQTVEESFSTKGGHCIVQAANLGAAFDLAGIRTYWIQGLIDPEKALRPPYGHDWLYLPEYDLIVSNGEIERYGTVLCYGYQGAPHNRIDFVQVKETWAYIQDLKVIGTCSPGELRDMLVELTGFHNEEIFILEDMESFGAVPLDIL